RLHPEAGMHDQDLRIAHHEHDRREILHDVVRQLLVEVRVGSEGVERHHDRVAVGGRLGELSGADDAAGGDAGLDEQGLAQRLGTTKGWPSASASLGARRRAAMSEAPPALDGTYTWTGFEG